MTKRRTQFVFKGKQEHVIKEKHLNNVHLSQYIDTEIKDGSRDHVIVPDTLKFTFNFDSTDKTRSVVNNVGTVLVKKKVLILGSKETNSMSKSDIYDSYKDL